MAKKKQKKFSNRYIFTSIIGLLLLIALPVTYFVATKPLGGNAINSNADSQISQHLIKDPSKLTYPLDPTIKPNFPPVKPNNCSICDCNYWQLAASSGNGNISANIYLLVDYYHPNYHCGLVMGQGAYTLAPHQGGSLSGNVLIAGRYITGNGRGVYNPNSYSQTQYTNSPAYAYWGCAIQAQSAFTPNGHGTIFWNSPNVCN